MQGNDQSMEGKQGDFIERIALLFWTLVLTLSALTIYFNRIKLVREHGVLRFLSFFLLPVFLPALFWLSSEGKTGWSTFFAASIIFLLTHAFFYVMFLKHNSSTSTQVDN
jgi:hypothetical protein